MPLGRGYFNDSIRKIKEYSITINFVGGEPTLDLEKFQEIINYIIPHWDDCQFEMTTNGWWLESFESLHKFNRAVIPFLYNEQLIIRISHSPYHEKFRSKTLNQMINSCKEKHCSYSYNNQKTTPLEKLLDFNYLGSWLWEKEKPEEEDDFSMEFDSLQQLQTEAQNHHIYIDYQFQGEEKISPVGRAKLLRIGYQDGSCHPTQDVKFTFMPGKPGKTPAPPYDPCCNGGHVPLGHAGEGLTLFLTRMAFIQDLLTSYPEKNLGGDRCYNCPSFGAKWIKNNKPLFQKKIRDSIKSMEKSLVPA